MRLPDVLERPTLDWRAEGWRLGWAGHVAQPSRDKRVVAPRRSPPTFRLCRGPCHLYGADRRPVHKRCIEAAVTTQPTAPGKS